jgi:hypothetical protein
MVIFHSYVSLPEGTHSNHKNTSILQPSVARSDTSPNLFAPATLCITNDAQYPNHQLGIRPNGQTPFEWMVKYGK